MSLVSVVVPTYRRPHFLQLSLGSVLRQEHQDIEVIVCDNADQPETAEVVRAFDDPRVVYVPREVDLGMVASVYDGLRRARGEYVMKLDDDDVMHPECLRVLVGPLDRDPDVAVSASDFDYVDEHGAALEDVRAFRTRVTGRSRVPEGLIRPFTAAAARGSLDMVSALIRRSAVDWDAVDERAATAYDLHLLLTAAQDDRAAHYTSRRLVGYRQHGASDTVTHAVRQHRGALFAKRAALASGRHTDVEVLRAGVVATSVHLARELLRAGEVREARDVLRSSGAASVDREVIRLLGLTAVPPRLAAGLARSRARRASRG